MICLFVTQIWRTPSATGRGKFQEAAAGGADPDRWGYGQHVFEPIGPGPAQYRWLERALSPPEARRARYRAVMYHHPGHGLGDNSAPPFTDPVQTVHRDPATGEVTAVTYEYPLSDGRAHHRAPDRGPTGSPCRTYPVATSPRSRFSTRPPVRSNRPIIRAYEIG